MKTAKVKTLFLTIVLGAAFALSACGEQAKPNDTPPDDTPTEKTITGVTFEDKTVTYNGSEQELVFEGTLPEGVTVQYTGNKGTNAGTYSAKADFSGTGYTSLHLEAVLTIAKANAVITAEASQRFAYTGDPVTVEATLTAGVGELTYSEKPTDIGNYNITVSVAASENYNAASATVALEIYDPVPQLLLPDLEVSGLTKTYTGEALTPDVTGIPADVEYRFVNEAGETVEMKEAGSYTVYLVATKAGYHDFKSEAYTFVIEAPAEPAYSPKGLSDGELKEAWENAELGDGFKAAYIGLDYSSHGTLWAISKAVFDDLGTYGGFLSDTDVITGNWTKLNRNILYFVPANADGSYGEWIPWNHANYSAGSNLYNDPFIRKIDDCYFLWNAGNCAYADGGFTDGQGFRFGWQAGSEVHSVDLYVTHDTLCKLSTVAAPDAGMVYEISELMYKSFVLTTDTVEGDLSWVRADAEKAGICKWTYSARLPQFDLFTTVGAQGAGVLKKFSEMENVDLYVATDGTHYYAWIKNLQTSPVATARFNSDNYGFPHTYGILFWYNAKGELCEQAIKMA